MTESDDRVQALEAGLRAVRAAIDVLLVDGQEDLPAEDRELGVILDGVSDGR